MLKREFDADHLNYVANHPSVRAGAKIDQLDGPADFSPIVANLDNIILSFEGGCFLLVKHDDQYEIHTMTLKHGRGKAVRDAIGEVLDYLFTYTGCNTLVSMTAKDNHAATRLAKEFMTQTGEDDKLLYFSLPRTQWADARRAA